MNETATGQRETQRQVLGRLVASGRLTADEATEISSAPERSFSVRELFSYLAGLIILSGVIRIIALAFRDASQEVIGSVLLIIGSGLAAVAWRMGPGSDAKERFAEVVETVSLIFLGGGAAVLLDLTGISSKVLVLSVGAVVAAWGWWRSSSARFVGSLALSAGLPMVAFAVAALVDQNSVYSAATASLMVGALLWVVGQRSVGTAFLQRSAGCYFLLMGAFMIAGEASNDFSVLVPIVVGAAIFVLGSSNLQFESLVSGAVGVTAGMTIAVGEWLPSEFTRGITTIAVGAVMLFLTLGRMRRKRQSTSA
jgi:hypothetical protein